PLATSPALYPPIPSASTTRPFSPSEAIESSLCARTIPGSVQLAISSAPDKVIVPGFRFSKGDVDPGTARRGTRTAEGGPQLGREFLSRLVTLGGVFRHGLVEKGHERGGNLGVVLQDIRRVLVRDLVHELRHRVSFERKLAARELVETDGEREKVAPPVDLLPLQLLGRHVRRRPEHHPRLGL